MRKRKLYREYILKAIKLRIDKILLMIFPSI